MNTKFEPVGGSFRDPAGRVYDIDNRILRTVSNSAHTEYISFHKSSLYENFLSRNLLVSSTELPAVEATAYFPEAAAVIEHPRVPFISYPYEWCFGALKDAALLHLDIQLEALVEDVVLSDASAYNVQFFGPNPRFIDALSFRRYVPGQYWTGHRQFCEQFLNPLLFRSLLGVPFNAWYRGSLEGIPTVELARLLSLRHVLSFNVLTQVVLHAWLERRTLTRQDKTAASVKRRDLSKNAYQGLLQQMRSWIARLKPREYGKTVWGEYAQDNTYSPAEEKTKQNLVTQFTRQTSPGVVWDMGCNTGNYSIAALRGGAKMVIGFDFDHLAVERLYEKASTEGHNILPLWLDAANPSPSQGWLQSERMGLKERAAADLVLALAFEHHLAIGRNMPLGDVVAWLVQLAPRGIIEFVQKDDPTICQMLNLRDDIFPDYNEMTFRHELAKNARIVREETVSASGRKLFFFDRSDRH